jgi:hypothetical protein
MPPFMSLPRGLPRHTQRPGDCWPAEAPAFEPAHLGIDLSVNHRPLADQPYQSCRLFVFGCTLRVRGRWPVPHDRLALLAETSPLSLTHRLLPPALAPA